MRSTLPPSRTRETMPPGADDADCERYLADVREIGELRASMLLLGIGQNREVKR